MRYAIIDGSAVVNVIELDAAADPAAFAGGGRAIACGDDPVDIGWRWSEAVGFSPPEPSDTPPLDTGAYRIAIQSLIDAAAQARGYDSGLTCASYLGSTVARWAAEARAMVDWRDAVWSHALAELAKVEAGERPQPGVDELLAELPALVWPEA